MISALRAPAERANALLKPSWKALERVTLDPRRIGAITTAALVLLHLQRPASRCSFYAPLLQQPNRDRHPQEQGELISAVDQSEPNGLLLEAVVLRQGRQ